MSTHNPDNTVGTDPDSVPSNCPVDLPTDSIAKSGVYVQITSPEGITDVRFFGKDYDRAEGAVRTPDEGSNDAPSDGLEGLQQNLAKLELDSRSSSEVKPEPGKPSSGAGPENAQTAPKPSKPSSRTATKILEKKILDLQEDRGDLTETQFLMEELRLVNALRVELEAKVLQALNFAKELIKFIRSFGSDVPEDFPQDFLDYSRVQVIIVNQQNHKLANLRNVEIEFENALLDKIEEDEAEWIAFDVDEEKVFLELTKEMEEELELDLELALAEKEKEPLASTEEDPYALERAMMAEMEADENAYSVPVTAESGKTAEEILAILAKDAHEDAIFVKKAEEFLAAAK